MPIRPDLRPFYRGPAWRATRRRILERAGGQFDERGKYLGGAKCERCKVPDRELIARIDKYPGWWFTLDGEAHDSTGELKFSFRGSEFDAPDRLVGIVVTLAHLNRQAGDDRDENLAALCQACHNRYDAPTRAGHAKETRCKRKDERRPLLKTA
jgi:hypothetical protein